MDIELLKYVLAFVCCFLLIPIHILIHELGHAYFALLFTNKEVSIYMGEFEKTKYKLRMMRLTIYWNKALPMTGFVNTDKMPFNKYKHISIFLGGPLASIMMTIIYVVLIFYASDPILRIIYYGGLMNAIIQFFCTIIPVRYKHGGYKGMKSDGLHVLEIMRGHG
ncbi:site-2 protease family protein [Paenibacillus sp. KN14-4R]|uniref:site-2 protease family protein n=1 Tax=Paenibacillus sp. KN14-4R TaxID=3445773 RepID=UPI003F9F7D73